MHPVSIDFNYTVLDVMFLLVITKVHDSKRPFKTRSLLMTLLGTVYLRYELERKFKILIRICKLLQDA